MTIQRLALGIAVFVLFPAISGASTLIVVRQSFPARGLTREFRVFLQPPLVKKEIWSGRKLESTTILDEKEKIIRVIENTAGTYTESDFGKPAATSRQQVARPSAPAAASRFAMKEIPSGREQTQWPCKAMQMLNGDRKVMEACIAEGRQLGFGPDDMKLLSVSQLLMPMGAQGGTAGIAIWRKTYGKDTVVVEEKITEIRRSQPDLPRLAFMPPRNFRRKAR